MSKQLLIITLLIFGWLNNEVQTQSEGAIELDNGLLRVYLDGSWGFVCGTGWNGINSDVICKILGYGSGKQTLLIPRFVFGTEIDNVRCRGYETNILNCTYTTLPASCQQLINITCQYDDGDLRLPNNSNNGLLEIFYQNKWGHICDDFWSLAATDVACRKLGFRRAESFSYGVAQATNEFHIDDIICIGNESSLLECNTRNGHDCNANEHIEIHCKEDGCESYAPFADANSTVVEFYSESNWFYICSEGFTLENANVTCRENTQSTVEQYSSEIKSGVLDKEIFPYLFRCNGDEESLCACSKERRTSTCPSSSIVKVKCRAEEGKLTLIPGTSKHNGFVFINHLEQWKGICLEENSNINFLTAHVACKQLGHKGVYNFYSGPSVSSDINRIEYYVGKGKTFSWMMYPNCTGKENSISECRFNWTESFCSRNPLWVDCEPYKLNDVIFTRSSSDFQGVPNIFFNDNWYKLCISNDVIGVNILDALCHSFGASTRFQRGFLIPKSGNRFLTNDYGCFGNEENLQSCYTEEVKETTCESDYELYLICTRPSDETPSLRYGSSENGIVDIYASNSWGLACINSQEFTQGDVSVICNDLGLNGGKWNNINYANNIDHYYWNSTFNCNGNETTLSEGNCLEISEPQRMSECRQPFSPLKVYCRPSFNEMRLIPSSEVDGYYKVQILSPQHIWAPICSIANLNYGEICRLFGFETANGITGGTESSNIFAGITCNSVTDNIGQCQVAFTYDYMSIFGCQQSLLVSCNNPQVPRFNVENLKGVRTDPYRILLRWDYNYPISEENMNLSYYLRIATNTSDTTKQIKLNYIDQNVRSRYYSVGNLRPYTIYAFRILLKNSIGFGPQGESVFIRTDETAPSGPPLNIRVTSIEPLYVELEWEQPDLDKRNGLITKFDICFESFITLSCNTSFITQAISFQFRKTGLQPNTTYSVKIRASNSIGVGPFSVPLEFTTAPLPPASPPILVNRNAVSIKIRWQEYIFPVLHYSLCVTKSNEIGCNYNFITSNTSFLIPNLEPETEYFVTSAAVTEYGTSPTSEKQNFITASLPRANPPSLVNTSADSIEIRWEEYVFPVSNYSLCVRKSNEVNCENNFITYNLNFLIQNLEPETEYFVTITAITEYGSSPPSERRGFTTESLPSPIQPVLVDRDAVSIEIEWQEYLFPVFHYLLCVTKSNEIGCNFNFTTSNKSFLIQYLEPETEYFVTVSAVTKHGLSPKSNKSGFITEPLPPANPPVFVNRSANSIEIRWNEFMFPVLHYSLCVVKSNGIGCDNNFTTLNTNFLIQDLEPETNYSVTIEAVTGYGSSPASERRGFITEPLPSPIQPTLVDRDAVSIEIEWQEYLFPVLYYSLCVTKSNEIGCNINFTTSNTSFLIQNLEPETEYFVTISAVTEYCSSLTSERRGFTTESLPKPIQPTLVDTDAVSIRIEWQEYLFPVFYYSLCVTKSNEIGCSKNFTTSNTSFLIQNLEPETEYFVTISAVTEYGRSPKSNRTRFTTAPLPPASQPILVDRNAVSIQIRWEEYEFPVLHYSIYVEKSNKIVQENNFTISTNTSFLIQDLEPETEYFIRISAVTEHGPSPKSNRTGFTTEPLPSPFQPTLVDRDAVSIKIKWQEYLFPVLYYSLCVTKSNEIGYSNNTTSNTSFLIQNLEPETEYFVTISAFTKHGPSPKSNRTGFTTESLPPANPAICANRSADSIKIRWNEYMFPVLHYSLCVVKSNGNGCDYNFTTLNTSFLIKDLEPETEYFITVSAFTKYGPSPKSNRTGFTTEPLPSPIQPTRVGGDVGSIKIKWQEYLFPVLYYLLCVTKSNEIDCNNNFTTSNTSFLIHNLEPKTKYFVTVYAVTKHGLSPNSSNAGFTTAPLPPASSPIFVNKSAVSIKIRWQEYIFPVLHYLLCVTKSNEIGCNNSFTTSNTSFLISNLEPETEYFVTSAAVTEYGPSPTSGKQNFTTAPLPQANLPSLVNTSTDSIEIRWKEYLFPVTNYSLCVRKLNEIGCEKSFTTSKTTFLIEGLQAATNYSVTIVAVTKTSKSMMSDRLNFTTDPLPQPSLPIFVKINIADSIKIEWEAYLFPVIHYSLCVIKSNEIGCNSTITTSETSYILQNLESETIYFITITVFTDIGESPASERIAFATENIPPTITSPLEDIERKVTDISTYTNFNLTQECTAIGCPQPTVTWSGDLSMKFVIGNVLSIKSGDLVEIKDINPLRFICKATNSEGFDTKIVKILVRIDISAIIDKLINVTDEQATNLTNIITINTNGIDTSADNTTVTRQELEKNAKDLENLVGKYLNTSKSLNNNTVINLLDTARAIINKNSEFEEEEIKSEVQRGQNNIAPASPVLLTTLNTVENIASNAAQRIEDSENGTSLIYRARTITVIAQNINLSEIDPKIPNLIIPKEENGIEDGIKERIQIQPENFGIHSSNNPNLRIAITRVDTMETRSETKKVNSSRLFSNIISLVIPSKTDQKIELVQPVKLIFPISQGNPNSTFKQVCSFLGDVYWSDEGLRTDEMDNVTFCYTDHLTSFAVFVTPRDLGPDNRIASIVSYAVVSISFISLIVSLVLFILSGKKFFKVEANIVYFNYCLSLTLAFGLFLFGIETGKFNEIVCKIIAFLLHYLWLSVFVWTLCNGILIIYKLTLGILRQQKIYPYLIVFGWTFPIVIPIITVAIKHDKYVDTTQHCFLTYEDGIIWAFITPIITIILVNMVILVISVIRISTTKFGSEKLKEKQVIKAALVSTLILTPLLGIPWVILLLNIFIVDPVVQWGFIITNGLMGIFFFFAITMRNTEVKKLLKKKKGEYSQMSISTENKPSGILSNKFKRSVSRETTDTLSPSHTEASKKGNYFALEPMGTSEVQDDGREVKSPTGSLSSRYNTPPRPKNLPKPKPKSSRDESGQDICYNIPATVKPDQTNIYDMLAPKDAEGEKDSPESAEIPEESSFSGFEYPSNATKQNTGKSVEVDKKVYQSLN